MTLSIENRIGTVISYGLDKEINEEFCNFDSLIMDFTGLEYLSSAGLRV